MEQNNTNLRMSKAAKQDEFYTQAIDVNNELNHYQQHFKGKTIYCNCDDPTWSEFWRYFHLNFTKLGLKKLISTHYDKESQAYKLEYCGGDDQNPEVGIKTTLVENGDFRSKECLEILHNCDICVTNPPFSLMKLYLPCLIESGKEFLILGNLNHVTMKDISGCFLSGKCWLGFNSGHFWFKVPSDYEEKGTDYKQDKSGQKWRRIGNCCWFTNIEVSKSKPPLLLKKKYSAEKYQKYDNYNVIEISKVEDIPMDYFGVMGVPITFLPKHCPSQFKLLGLANSNRYIGHPCITKINGKNKYQRLLIQRVGGESDGQ